MLVELLERRENEFARGLDEVEVEEIVGVEGAEVEAIGVCVEGLFEKDVTLVVLVGFKVDLGLSNLSYIYSMNVNMDQKRQ